MDSTKTIKLLSSDDKEFIVADAVAKKSVTIKNMLEDIGDDPNSIPLPNVNGKILDLVIKYIEHHANDAEPTETKDEKNTSDISGWDADFIKIDQATLFELILAANYLDIKSLLDLTCKSVANMIKGKTPEEIRKTFSIKNDFTPEEEAQIRKENEWIEEK